MILPRRQPLTAVRGPYARFSSPSMAHRRQYPPHRQCHGRDAGRNSSSDRRSSDALRARTTPRALLRQCHVALVSHRLLRGDAAHARVACRSPTPHFCCGACGDIVRGQGTCMQSGSDASPTRIARRLCDLHDRLTAGGLRTSRPRWSGCWPQTFCDQVAGPLFPLRRRLPGPTTSAATCWPP